MSVIMEMPRSNEPLSADFLTRQQLADELGTSVRTLDRWHARREGPPRISHGKLVLYRRSAVRSWLASLEIVPVNVE